MSSDSIGKQMIGIANGIATFGLVFNNQMAAFLSNTGVLPPDTKESVGDAQPVFSGDLIVTLPKREEDLICKPPVDNLKVNTLNNIKNIEELNIKKPKPNTEGHIDGKLFSQVNKDPRDALIRKGSESEAHKIPRRRNKSQTVGLVY